MVRAAASALACMLLPVACGDVACGDSPAPRSAAPPGWHGNLLANPGFEEGEAGWSYPVESPSWGRFEIVESPTHGGRRAAHLRLRAGREDRTNASWIVGVMQEARPQRFPDRMGGFYRVEAWEKEADATHLYLQAVAIVWSPEAAAVVDPRHPELHRGLRNYQLRVYLAGVAQAPFLVSNAKVAFVTREPPRPGRWRYFEIPLREEFERQWGGVPERYEKLRVLFEARWDTRPPGSRVEADAYFDDLFLGYADP
jgi:hypothetical protein